MREGEPRPVGGDTPPHPSPGPGTHTHSCPESKHGRKQIKCKLESDKKYWCFSLEEPKFSTQVKWERKML